LSRDINILFVVSKSTGYIALKSYLRLRGGAELSVLVLDDRSDIRSDFSRIVNLCSEYEIEPAVAQGKSCLGAVLASVSPKMLFVCGWYWIIPDELLAQVPLGSFGVHNSLLPKYRGHAPLVWSMINGDEVVGASLFQIESGMDTGDVFHQWRVRVDERYLTEVLHDLDAVIERELGSVLHAILNGEVRGAAQDNLCASYSAKRREEDGLICWEDSAESIILKIKALSSPYPNAFTFIGPEKVFLQKAQLFEGQLFAEVGQVVFCSEGYAVICCGNQQGIKVTKALGVNQEKDIRRLFSRLSSPIKRFEFN